MKKLLFLILIFCACEKPPDLTGEWKGTANEVDCELSLTQEHNRITGDFFFAGYDTIGIFGYVRGECVTMKVNYEYLTLLFTGKTDFHRMYGKTEWICNDTVRSSGEFIFFKQ